MSSFEKPRRGQGQKGYRSRGGSNGSSHNYRQDGDKQGGNPRGQRRHQGDPESYNSNQRGNYPNHGGYNKRYKDKTEGNLDPTAQEFTPKDASPTLMGDNSEEGSFISSSASESCDVSLSEAAKHLPKEPIIEEQKPTWDAFTDIENPASPGDNDTVVPTASGEEIQGVRYKNQKGAVKKHQKSIDVAPMPDQLEANMNFSNKATSYEIFDQKLPSLRRTIKFVVVSEEQGNLFEKDKSYALANCVAADLNMGSGIALTFRQDFKGLGELMAQGPHTGGLVYLHFKEERYIYYLVTKRESVKKPTYETLYKSLEKLREHMVENNVKLLAIPRLGCGLDRLEWDIVKVMIEYIFTGTDIKITVCNYQQNHGKTKQKLQTKADASESKTKHSSKGKGKNKKQRY